MANKGLARAKEIYKDQSRRAKELKAQGKKILGYICIYAPLEIVTALGVVPCRIFGDMREPATQADRGLPTAFCPYMRSLFDLALKGKYDFLDGMVAAHSCDAQEKGCHVWESLISYPYFHFIDIPSTQHKAALETFKEELKDFKKTLESFVGKEFSPEELKRAIEAYNQQRSLVRELYSLKKSDPPLISGVETLQVMAALMCIPLQEGNELLREVIGEVKERKDGPQKKPVRLLIWGSTIDDIALVEIMESAGANVVMDDTCVGSRAYGKDVEITDDPFDGLAHHYLVDLVPPRTFKEATYGGTSKDYRADLEYRFGYLKDFAQGWKVNGVILHSVRYCDPHGFEVPGVKDYFDSLGLPNIYLEHDYKEGSLAPLRTRVQAFLEMIG